MTINKGTHEASEKTEGQHNKSQDAVIGTPITGKDDNAVQKRQEMQTAMKAFRLTRDSNNSFALVDNAAGTVTTDKRPIRADAANSEVVLVGKGPSEQVEQIKPHMGLELNNKALNAVEQKSYNELKDVLSGVAPDAGALKEAMKGLTPEQAKHVVDELNRNHVVGLNTIEDKSGLHVFYGGFNVMNHNYMGSEVYSPSSAPKEGPILIDRQPSDSNASGSASRDLTLQTMMWLSLESGGHRTGDEVLMTDKQGHEHSARVGKVINGHVNELVDDSKNPPVKMSVEAYKKKYHVDDVARFSWPSEQNKDHNVPDVRH